MEAAESNYIEKFCIASENVAHCENFAHSNFDPDRAFVLTIAHEDYSEIQKTTSNSR